MYTCHYIVNKKIYQLTIYDWQVISHKTNPLTHFATI